MDDHPWTPPRLTEAFCDQANHLFGRGTCEVDEIPEPRGPTGRAPLYFHGFMLRPLQYRRMMGSMDRFLTAHGILAGAPEEADARVAQLLPGSVCEGREEAVFAWTKELHYDQRGGLWAR
jgi:hypothetical protein